MERFVNIFGNQTNCLRLGMVKWKECKWIDYCDEQGKQIFDVPSSKGDRLQSFFKIFDYPISCYALETADINIFERRIA